MNDSTVLKLRSRSTAGSSAFFGIFFLAGIPALVYQVVWQRALALYFGVDIYSTTVTVSAFMLGLGVGSLTGGWLSDRVRNIALVYAIVEIAIGAVGLLSLNVISSVGMEFSGSSFIQLILVNGALLFIPTCLMGMTLPLMIKLLVSRNGSIARMISGLYGINTFGAAIGALVTSYVLIGTFGFERTVFFAAVLNVMLGLFFLVFEFATRNTISSHEAEEPGSNASYANCSSGKTSSLNIVLLFAFVSGFIALAYEIVLYRVVGIILHGTVYVFGTHLFVFLGGIAFGSLYAQKSIANPGSLKRFGYSQIGIAMYATVLFTVLGTMSYVPGLKHLLAASFFTYFHPSIELVSGEISLVSLYSLFDIFFWTGLLVFPIAFLMGFGFPNLISASSRQYASLGRSIGYVYFANIVGSAVGGTVTGFVFLHYFGSEMTLLLLIIAGLVAGWLAWQSDHATFGAFTARWALSGLQTKVGALVVVVLVVAVVVFPSKSALIKSLHLADFESVDFKVIEDKTGVVAIRQQRDIIAFSLEKGILGPQRLYIDGSTHGFTSELGSSTDESAELALAAHSEPRRVLLIGLGDARIPATAAVDERVLELVIVELKESLLSLVSQTRQGRLLNQAADKTRHIVDDGRRWLLAHPSEKFDVIMMYPLHAAHASSGTLFSVEFFNLLKLHLNPSGIVFFKNADPYSTAHTFSEVFSHIVRVDKQGYVGSETDLVFDSGMLGVNQQEVAQRLTASGALIRQATQGSPVNTDYNPNSEFYLNYQYRKHMSAGASIPYADEPQDMLAHVK